MEKLDEYNDITTRLVGETIACCPDGWEAGTLSMQSDGVKLTYQLRKPDHPDKASISELLRDLIDELYVRMARHGDIWLEASAVWWREGNDAKFKISYVYPEPKKAPWWNILAKSA
ncbi:hypothetical protein [Xanthomonas sp. D-109]|uniref:hypothetical protein n=1 Tax=Xanthomonas sp. D-109 TaxID=2821274 RepID=UPI001AD9E7FB|nr:hypothetical protein [Xanthomonas sp. D-109]MBO9880706.1 hypothetical protein [Xanthomonas sp. D-109]